jgi:hypothetical protein
MATGQLRNPKQSSECVAGMSVRSTRGYIRGPKALVPGGPDCLLEPKAISEFNPEYRPGDCGIKPCDNKLLPAEAIAQARLIAQINQHKVYGDQSIGGISANIQWEPRIPNSSGQQIRGCGANRIQRYLRPDLLLYKRGDPSVPLEVAEIKQTPPMGSGRGLALTQATAYVNELTVQNKNAILLPFNSPLLPEPRPDGALDHFRIVLADCDPQGPQRRTGASTRPR